MKVRISKLTKLVCLIISALMLLTLFSGCGTQAVKPADNGKTTATEPTAASLKGEITVWAWGDYEQKLVTKFNEAYQDIKVNFLMIPSTEFVPKLQTAFASGGDMPDVALLESAPRGMLANIDAWEKLDAPPYNLNKADIIDYQIPLISNKKGEIVCMEENTCSGGLAYRRDLAQQYFGVSEPEDMEKLFTDWNVFLDKGKEIAEKSSGQITMFSGLDDAYGALSGQYFDAFVKDGKLNLEPTFKPIYESLAKMINDKSSGKLIAWTPAWNASFASNKVIFYPSPGWFVPFCIKPNDKEGTGKWGLMQTPGGGAFNWGGTALAIPKTSKNKDLAWQYIKWMTLSKEGSAAWLDIQGVLTAYKPALEEPGFYSQKDDFFKGQDIMAKYADLAKKIQARPITEYDSTVGSANGTILREIEKGMHADKAYAKLIEEVLAKAPELK